jgi:hypothetical protein
MSRGPTATKCAVAKVVREGPLPLGTGAGLPPRALQDGPAASFHPAVCVIRRRSGPLWQTATRDEVFHAPAMASDGDAAQHRETAPTCGPSLRTGFRELTMPATARHLVLLQGRGWWHRRVLGAETPAAVVAAGVSSPRRSVLRPVHVRSTRREQRRRPTAASLTQPPLDKPASRRITTTPWPLNPYVQATRGDQGECREQALRHSRGAVSQRHVRRGSVDARTGHDVDPQGVP